MTGFQEWQTPQALFEKLDREFVFDLDAAALATNAKCRLFYGPDSTFGTDGLSGDWDHFTVFCNPPWGKPGPWVMKAIATPSALCVLVLPSSTCTQWWHYGVMPYANEVRFVQGRVDYERPNMVRRTDGFGPRQATAIVIIRRGVRAAYGSPTLYRSWGYRG